MGDVRGFLKVKKQTAKYRPVCERLKDYDEVMLLRSDNDTEQQACRCMDCGVPFCHWGCPIGNYIPEWNDLVFHKQWQQAKELLYAANNFPEITGRICPAICEYACVLGINDDAVTIRDNELAIIEYAFKNGYIKANPPAKRTKKKVSVIGSGPAGLACADQLNKAGHKVVVFERDDKIGGILRYGIPDFKLAKWVLDRRLEILEKEGIRFETGIQAGTDIRIPEFKKEFDAVCLACGSRSPRDLRIEGRDLKGIYFAMDYLIQANKRINGAVIPDVKLIDAKDKRVVVIGGGDTGADCMGVAHRQGARCVIQIELFPQPAECRTQSFPWPKYPMILKTSSSHEEGGERQWSVLTKKFLGDNGQLKKLCCLNVEFEKDSSGCSVIKEVSGSAFEIEADMVILALGFLHPEKSSLIDGLTLDQRGNVKTDDRYMTSSKGVFCAGDMHRGQSLVVWAIVEGRRSAHAIDMYLMGESSFAASFRLCHNSKTRVIANPEGVKQSCF